MIKVVTELPVQGSDGVRTVAVRQALQGEHSGELYLSCNCIGGRYSWSPAGYRPCKHARTVIERLGIQLTAGHFKSLPVLA